MNGTDGLMRLMRPGDSRGARRHGGAAEIALKRRWDATMGMAAPNVEGDRAFSGLLHAAGYAGTRGFLDFCDGFIAAGHSRRTTVRACACADRRRISPAALPKRMLLDVLFGRVGGIDPFRRDPWTLTTGGHALGGDLRAFEGHSHGWLCACLSEFSRALPTTGTGASIYREAAAGAESDRSGMSSDPPYVMNVALIHMEDDPDWLAAVESDDPLRFGRALAESFGDIYVDGPGPGIIMFPTMRIWRRWSDAMIHGREIPVCVSTADDLGLTVPHDELRYAAVMTALESDGMRSYHAARVWIRGGYDNGHGYDVISCHERMPWGCPDDSASILGILDVCDVLRAADDDEPGTRCLSPEGLYTAIDRLEQGLPADMVAEMVR